MVVKVDAPKLNKKSPKDRSWAPVDVIVKMAKVPIDDIDLDNFEEEELVIPEPEGGVYTLPVLIPKRKQDS